jgi:hypothetical protein
VTLSATNPVWLAVIVAARVPSTTALSTAETGKLISTAPAGIVTVAGTVALLLLPLLKLTVSAAVVAVLRRSVAVAALGPPPSLNVVGLTLRVSAAAALSLTVTARAALLKAGAAAVTVTGWGPSARPLSMAPTVKLALEAPAGRTTVAGKRTLVASLLLSVTVSWLVNVVLVVMVPVAAVAPALSLNVLGLMASPSVGPSLSVTVTEALADARPVALVLSVTT